MQLFFAVTLFTSAMLLFVVQPMFAKMVLPLLGGSPAVWNTCMVFYQATLLAGYLYTHLTIRWLGVRRQAVLHLAVLCLPWLMLPIGVAATWTPPAQANPIPWLLLLLAVSVGTPFFVVSASAPMLQAWFAGTGHPAAKDPYFLYAASNLGSMIALLGYPVVVEPGLPLGGQSIAWAAGYGLLMGLTAGCAVFLWRWRGEVASIPADGRRPPHGDRPAEVGLGAAPTFARRMRWLVLSFAPSSLLLGVTAHISTDIAAVPLLWVVPLALYLLTFVLVFARRQLLPHGWMVRAQPYVVLLLAVLFYHTVTNKTWLMLLLHLAAFFTTSMVCHGELARTRPAVGRLTEFYLWMSVGGVLGGLFNALVAPALFSGHVKYLSGIIEYPLVIAVACLLRPRVDSATHAVKKASQLDVLLPLAVLLGFGGLVLGLKWADIRITEGGAAVILALAGLVAFGFQKRPLRFGLSVGAVLIIAGMCFGHRSSVMYVERNFFGVVRVKYNSRFHGHVISHGSTNHGIQSLHPERREQPLAYYHRSGPLGDVFEAVSERKNLREIGIIGLGAGSIAGYGQPGQRITYYEIDPAVERIARDARYFTFLADSRAEIDVVLGDARLTLGKAPNGRFDLLILDAFTSDAIPIHLITREAIQLYFDKLTEDGVLALHVSNRYFDLTPVLSNIAQDRGVVCRIRKDNNLSVEHRREGKLTSTWAVMARRPEYLDEPLDGADWEPAHADPNGPLWTDDFSNILTVLNWW